MNAKAQHIQTILIERSRLYEKEKERKNPNAFHNQFQIDYNKDK